MGRGERVIRRWVMAMLLGTMGGWSVAHAELLIDKTPATVQDESSVQPDAPDASRDSNGGDGDLLFSKPTAPVIPHRPKDLQCASLKAPKAWDRALGWRTPDQPLPSWGWDRARWCGDLDRVLDHLSIPVNQLGRWAACDGAKASGKLLSSTMATLCAARYNPKDWVEMRPRMTVYSVGTWTVQGQACPSVVMQLDQLSGALGGSTTHVLTPLEGHCPEWHGFNPMTKNWTAGPVTPALVAEGQQRWAGYEGEVPDGWRVAFVPLGQAASTTSAPVAWPIAPDPNPAPVMVQGLALPPAVPASSVTVSDRSFTLGAREAPSLRAVR